MWLLESEDLESGFWRHGVMASGSAGLIDVGRGRPTLPVVLGYSYLCNRHHSVYNSQESGGFD